MLSDPFFLFTAITAILLIAISKAGFGGMMGSIAVPLVALSVSAPQAAAILLPIMLVMDTTGLLVFRGKADATNLRVMLPGAMVGLVLGAVFFHWVDARWIKAIIGIEALLFGLSRLRPTGKANAPRPPEAAHGVFWGCVSGFTSFISHAGGPPILQYLLPQEMERVRMVATMTIFFSVVNFTKLIPYAILGLLDTSNLMTSASLLPVVPLGYWIGLKLLKTLSQSLFNRIITVAMILTGVKLLYDVL
ncbi:MAG: sulfite exporter TauE/SafE family protein [Candidatus Accumulibacter sp.]|jgi:uncharacterized membrane protein YfcA|nr:sulfite exporter TauE/SafE family protein [Accumulibacter sp.]